MERAALKRARLVARDLAVVVWPAPVASAVRWAGDAVAGYAGAVVGSVAALACGVVAVCDCEGDCGEEEGECED
jgi:hypothetical protein